MRNLRRHPATRWVARVTAVLMVVQYLLVPAPVSAQRSTPAVYVLDFNNATTVGGALLGKVAAAQMSLQLSESQNWDVVQDGQVQKRIQELNLQPPFDRVNRVQIATGIDATASIYGKILDARVTGGTMPQAYVKLQVVVEDVRTATLVNGAISDGISTPRMGYSGNADILLEEAIGKATFKAREAMDRFRLPEGTVLNTNVIGGSDNPAVEALLNIGIRHGVKRGMEMIVTRQREPVGRLRITQVDADISTGRVIENIQGVRPEDRVRAIFNFSDFAIGGNRRAALNGDGPTAVAGTLPGAGVDPAQPRVARVPRGGEFVQAKSPSDGSVQITQTTVQPPPQVVIDEPDVETKSGGGASRALGGGALRMLVGGALVMGILMVGGRGGQNASRVHGVDAAAYQRVLGQQGAFIKVQWERPKSVKSSQVLGYVVWRADDFGGFQVVGGLDNDGTQVFIDNTSTRDVTAYDGDPGSDDAGGRTTFADVPGIVPGQQYRYQVATAYRNGLEDRDGDGMPDQDAEFMSPLSSSSTWVTAIAPPVVSGINDQTPSPAREVDLNNLAVSWQQTPGSDQYQILVSGDPDFHGSQVYKFGPYRTSPVDQGGPSEVTKKIDANKGTLRRLNRVYVAVGGRNSFDRSEPVPRGFIISSFVTVKPILTPPDPPGSNKRNGPKVKPTKEKGPTVQPTSVGNGKG